MVFPSAVLLSTLGGAVGPLLGRLSRILEGGEMTAGGHERDTDDRQTLMEIRIIVRKITQNRIRRITEN